MKKTLLTSLSLAGSILLLSQPVLAEPHPGQELHESSNCLKCHADKPYNPDKTTSFEMLVKRVQYCNDNLNTGLFEDEVEELADYLNETYYHMPK
ncbi:MAG: hypothetical protein ISEC1_P1324 [Thiomicrorhabdus sp.]|nr:MAG: hypothetical protein ISEC1_P1324 [Thiomicrorhabdus sp.]